MKLYRDFSPGAKQTLLNMVSDVENEKLSNFTDWVGDQWLKFESWIGKLNIKNYLNNVNDYHKKVLDKNNATKDTIERIYNNVNGVDKAYGTIFNNLITNIEQWNNYLREMGAIIHPAHGSFNAADIKKQMSTSLKKVEASEIQCLRDQMMQDVNGELTFDEELIYEYFKKSPGELTDAEKALLLDVVAKIKDLTATYETLAILGTDQIGADIFTHIRWISESTKYDSFTAVSAHYNDMYVNLLNMIQEETEEGKSFAASLAEFGLSEGVLSLIGVETYESLKDVFGTKESLKIYAAKYVSEHSEQYFGLLEKTEKESLKISADANKLNDWLEDKLKDHDLYDEDKETKYYDLKKGKFINEKDAPDFYKRKMTIAEYEKEAKARVALYDNTFDTALGGKATFVVGEAEAHANASAGFYVVGKDKDGKEIKIFSPGVRAEVGASATALKLDYENQLLGDEMLGLNASGNVVIGEASATAGAEVSFMGKDKNGKVIFDPQVNIGAKAELVAAKAEGKVGVNVLGGEVGVKGSVKVGIGANADVGIKDGVVKCEIGASFGIGFDVGFEVDVGGMVNTVADAASSAWDGLKKGWNSLWGK